MTSEQMRLQRFLAQCGMGSRRKCEELIAQGAVSVNGDTVTTLGTKVKPQHDIVTVHGKVVRAAEPVLLLLYKPPGVVTTMHDPEGRRCIKDLLTPRYRSCFPVGRLDYESEGLVIVTNDGELADLLLHPRYGVERTYRVLTEHRVPDPKLSKLEAGVRLPDGMAKARVLHVEDLQSGCWLELSVREGRNRLVRRIMEAIGYPVRKLIRLQHGPFRLGSLRPGELRKLSQQELLKVRRQLLQAVGQEEQQ
ncbi:MAG: pseudouridine synthase [Bdellovibrionota bacterium]|nr:MAG: pseudouridine synthase [Bdellovibrionota bacterium]